MASPTAGMVPALSQTRMTAEEQSYAIKYLQHLLPTISKVLLGVRYVQTFELSDKKEWADNKLAGSLYIIERKDEPKFCLMVASKHTLDTLLLPVTESLLLEMKITEGLKVHALYIGVPEDESKSKTYCINFESAETAKEAFGLLEELKVKEGRRKFPKELKKELKDALKVLATDEDFVELLAEKIASLRMKVMIPSPAAATATGASATAAAGTEFAQ